MKRKYKILLGTLSVLLLIILLGLGWGANFLYNLALNPSTPKDLIFSTEPEKPTEQVNQSETSGIVNIDDTQWLLEESNYEDLFLTSKDSLKLHHYVLNQPNSHKWIITVHGYTSEGISMASYARKFYDMGYNVIIPDLRGHGQSEGDYIGMGWDERHDIIELINTIIKEDPDSQIALFGVSMGAATVMNVSGEPLPSNVKAIIEDCGYTSVWDEFSHQLDTLFSLPPFPMMHLASFITNLRAGYWLGEASPITQVQKSTIPTLFIHGDQDDFVPFFMLDELFEASSAPKEKLVIEGAGHGKASTTNPTLYWSTVSDFLNRYIP